MIPKRSSLLYKEVAEELNIPAELVEDLVQSFYKNIRHGLTNLSHPRINVEGLGQFVARPGLVKKSIQRYKKALDSHDTSTFKAYYNKKMLEDKVECLENLSVKIEEMDLKKNKFKEDKYGQKSQSNLEKPETDI
jgi:nucleoid DNA-binding protein